MDEPAGERRFLVVVNGEGQYSVWAEGAAVPAGWHSEGTSGSRAECLAHIERMWTDMRPASVRAAMQGT
jgi:MbtH protein